MLRNSLVGLVFLFAAVGCGNGVGNDGAAVGGSCTVSSDCEQLSRCLTGVDWPGGMCTLSCDTTADCAEGSVCVESEGGVCVVDCAECRGDEGYGCVEYEARGASGTVMGCGLE